MATLYDVANKNLKEVGNNKLSDKHVGRACEIHNLPFLYWGLETKELLCKKCVVNKQKSTTFKLIEDSLDSIREDTQGRLNKAHGRIKSDVEQLESAHFKAVEKQRAISKFREEIQKYEVSYSAYVKNLETVKSHKKNDAHETQRHNDSLKDMTSENSIGILQACHAQTKKLTAGKQVADDDVDSALLGHIACSYMEEAESVTKNEQTSCEAFISNLTQHSRHSSCIKTYLKQENDKPWVVYATDWQAAVSALNEQQPKEIKIISRDDKNEDFPASAVGAVAEAARDCKVIIRFLDTFYNPKNTKKDMKRLEAFKASNTSGRLHVFYGHLDEPGIALLPPSVATLGLAIGNTTDAEAVSELRVWEQLLGLHVFVSNNVYAQDLKPLPVAHGRQLCRSVHFRGLTDRDMDDVRPVLDALLPEKRLDWLCLPKCELSVEQACELAHSCKGIWIGWVTLDMLHPPKKNEQEIIKGQFQRFVESYRVDWDTKWVYE